jgi:succinate dehydrogenase/fumarate reductase flavoprotein subunit
MQEEILKTDVLVIGGAGAGLRAAIEARVNGVDVTLASKMPVAGVSCTLVMAGWITGATQENEDQLFKQIVYTGGYINNQRLTDIFVKDAIHSIPELRDFGIELEFRPGETPDMPAHYMTSRIDKNPKGYSLLQKMKDKAEDMGVKTLSNVMISNLITSGDTVVGAVGVDLASMKILTISTKSVIIATGGGAYAFERSDNPPGSTGDGFSLAYRAGAEFVDMEFVSLNVPKTTLQEIFNVKGEPPDSIIGTGTAHYFVGGIKIDENCRTNVKGLFAAGEVTGGILGAARLGGTAVADTIVFGARSGYSASQWAKSVEMPKLNINQVEKEKNKIKKMTEVKGISSIDALAKVKSILWRYIGPVKNEYTLNKALEKLSEMESEIPDLYSENAEELQAGIEASNIVDLGKMLATASLIRTETRGNFWRADYPDPDNKNWLKNVVLWKDGDDIKTRIDDVIMTRLHSPVDPPIGSGCFWYFPKMDIS